MGLAVGIALTTAWSESGAARSEDTDLQVIIAAGKVAQGVSLRAPGVTEYDVRYSRIDTLGVEPDKVIELVLGLPALVSEPTPFPSGEADRLLEGLSTRLAVLSPQGPTTPSTKNPNVQLLSRDHVVLGMERDLYVMARHGGAAAREQARLFADGLELWLHRPPAKTLQILPQEQPKFWPNILKECVVIPVNGPESPKDLRIVKRWDDGLEYQRLETGGNPRWRVEGILAKSPVYGAMVFGDGTLLRRLIWRTGSTGPRLWLSLNYVAGPSTSRDASAIRAYEYSEPRRLPDASGDPVLEVDGDVSVIDERVRPWRNWKAGVPEDWPAELKHLVAIKAAVPPVRKHSLATARVAWVTVGLVIAGVGLVVLMRRRRVRALRTPSGSLPAKERSDHTIVSPE